MNRIEIFEKVLEKLKFREPVPQGIKKFVLNNKPKSLIRTLKQAGQYSFVYNYTLKIYYSLGRSGISLSVAQSKIILGLVTALLAASVSAGTVLSYNYLVNRAEQIQDVEEITEEISRGVKMLEEKAPEPEDTAAGINEKEQTSRPEIKKPVKDKNISAKKTKEVQKLSVVTTKDGKIYTGSFRSRGQNVEVETSEGKIIIPSEEIKSISPYKGD